MGEDEEEDPEENPEENPEEDPEEGETMKVARIWFKSLQARKEASSFLLEEVNGVPIRLVRAANHRIVLLVRGLDPEKSESDIKAQLTKHFDSCGGIKKIFIPKDENGRCLSFGYVFMVQEGHKAEMKDSSVMEGGGVIRVSDCTLQARFKKIKEKMEAEGWVNSEEEEEEEDEEDGIVFGDEEIEDDDSEGSERHSCQEVHHLTTYRRHLKAGSMFSLSSFDVTRRLFLNATSGRQLYFDKETNAEETYFTKVEFVCPMKVTGFNMDKGWCYVSCSRCTKKLQRTDGKDDHGDDMPGNISVLTKVDTDGDDREEAPTIGITSTGVHTNTPPATAISKVAKKARVA
uniref:RRM domain-containing protein n=1 Tax=Brassica oleracea TaxID=3712 RepID=A0A3P6C3W4_BRAOL|nr:unnamed protein product [Brassica oleracea]